MLIDPHRHPNGVKKRRHHNNKGERQIQLGKTIEQVAAIADRLNIPYVTKFKARKHKERMERAKARRDELEKQRYGIE